MRLLRALPLLCSEGRATLGHAPMYIDAPSTPPRSKPLAPKPSRPNVVVFSSFNLTVPAGKTVALVGESGAAPSAGYGVGPGLELDALPEPRRGNPAPVGKWDI